MNPFESAVSDIGGSLNTVFGAALGSYLGIVIANPEFSDPDLVSIGHTLLGFSMSVIMIQILVRVPAQQIRLWYVIPVLLGVWFYRQGRIGLLSMEVNTDLVDVIFICWFGLAILLNLVGHPLIKKANP